jgi:hypothetical protein
MLIERKRVAGLPDYFTVLVHPNELKVDSGKRLPYSTWIGTVSGSGDRINLWTPAAYKPRGYKTAALRLLAFAQSRIRAGDLLDRNALEIEEAD